MSEHDEFAQARGCIGCRDGRDPCNPLSPDCESTKEMDRMMSKFAQADQARESRDQEAFKGIPVADKFPPASGYGRDGVYRRQYLSQAEKESVRTMEREQGTPLVPLGAWMEGVAVGLNAIELAAIENCLAAERMGMATEDECMEALAGAGRTVLYKPVIPGCRWCRNGEVACGLPEGCRAELARAGVANAVEAGGLERDPGVDPEHDMVNLPAHYARFKVEPISFIVENGLNWFQGNIVKYASRAEHKHATPEEDISKIIRYAEMWKKFAAGDKDWWR